MASRFKFLLLYFTSWVLFFELMRGVFMLYHWDKTSQLSFTVALSTLWHGLLMDLSVAAYLLGPVCLFMLAGIFIPFFSRSMIYRAYTYLALLLILLVSVADLEIYGHWGFRIDSTPLRFLSTPREALASVSHLPLLGISFMFVLVYIFFLFLFNNLIRVIFFKDSNGNRISLVLLLLLFMAGLVIPMRGGLQLAPLNQSSVYFSTNNYANHAAINASWNLLHSLMSSGSSGVNPYHYLPAGRVKAIVDSLYAGKDNAPHLIRYTEGNPVNVILVVWESFTHKALDRSEGEKPVMPRFNSLIQEGIYFSQVYASGDRTNKGLPALLSGYPSLPKTTVIHSPSKSQKLQVLSRLFAGKGYSTSFFYGGEPEFANIKSYLLFGGFDPIIGKGDFTQSDMNSKWGAHDGVVKDKVLAELNKQKKPFFATWLTLSSHEPFETPEKAVIEGKSNTSRFLNSLHYTDKVLGEFIDECKRQEWWKNTVIIVTGDHGHPLPETTSKADDFRIPMLWLGGALDSTGLVINTVLSQVDLASTLAFQVGLPGHQFPFSRNALVSGDRKWAFFTFNDGFGFIDSSGRLLYDNVGRRPIKKEGHTGYAQEESGKALMQWIYDDFLRK